MTSVASRVLESGKVNYWTGEEGGLFEQEYAASLGCRHAIAVANGTLALELALRAVGVGPGDEVIVPSRTFIATASSVVAVGARPVCADVELDSQTVSATTIAPHITSGTRAVIPVHLAGWPCDMDPILDLAAEHSLAVVEDCAQAHGAVYKGRPVGAIGDIGAYSFCQDKIITTGGEGGMVVTNREELWDRAWRFKDHGKTPDAFYGRPPQGSGFRWLHESFGSNYRLTEMQSAIGREAVRLLPSWTQARTANAEILLDHTRSCEALRTPTPPTSSRHAWYKFYTFVRPEHLRPGWDRDRIKRSLDNRGVQCFTGSCSEIYLEQAFPADWRPTPRHPNAKTLGETSLMFRVDPALSAEHMRQTGEAIVDVMLAATNENADPAAA